VTPEADLFFWLLARATGIAAFLALSIATLSGVALRTSVLDRLGTNRAWRELHTFSTVLWIPLGGAHLVALLLDRTARIAPQDLLVPFGVLYGAVPVGLGTVAFDVYLVVTVTGWMKRHMSQPLWSWIHRLSYPAFGVTFAHAVLSGTDFSAPIISAFAWSIGFAVVVLALARIAWGGSPRSASLQP
jgi:DMSO/TMAO reductase YedYZ heme-binding membrane subunit